MSTAVVVDYYNRAAEPVCSPWTPGHLPSQNTEHEIKKHTKTHQYMLIFFYFVAYVIQINITNCPLCKCLFRLRAFPSRPWKVHARWCTWHLHRLAVDVHQPSSLQNLHGQTWWIPTSLRRRSAKEKEVNFSHWINVFPIVSYIYKI